MGGIMMANLVAHLVMAFAFVATKPSKCTLRSIFDGADSLDRYGGSQLLPSIGKQRKLVQAMVVLTIGLVLVSCSDPFGTIATIETPRKEITETLPSPTEREVSEGTGISPTESSGPIESAPSDPSTPITARLILSKVPKLNEVVNLTFTFSSVLDAPGTSAAILLPDGAVLVDGDLEWAGDLAANNPQSLQARFKFITEGNFTLEAKALRPLDNGDVWGDAAYIYLHVSEESSHVGFSTEPPPYSSDKEAPSPPSVNPSP
jgi:hypothetical protein